MMDKSSSQERILEAIELSDRGRDEPSDPATAELGRAIADRPRLAELRRRSKQLDDMLRRAVRDVPVPGGLAQRILANLGQSTVQLPKDETPAVDRPQVAPPPRRSDMAANSPRRASRRRWLAAVSAGAVAGAMIVAGLLCLWSSDGYTPADVLGAAAGQFVAGDVPPGESLSQEVLASHPPSDDVRHPADMRWRKVAGFLGREAVAYEMVAEGGSRATLFVLRCSRPIAGLAASPPDRPQRATGGKAMAAWQTGEMLYVLVVAGGERAYRSFVDLGRPLA